MSGSQEITYALDFCASKRSQRESTATFDPSPADGNGSSIPRIARLMALARLGRVTRARMTQIMKLLDLAPDIQEEILFLPSLTGLNERNLRPVVSRIDWNKQRRMFQNIMDRFNRAGDSA